MQKPARSKGEKAHLLRSCFRILTNISFLFWYYLTLAVNVTV
jgi:hypothetical protein